MKKWLTILLIFLIVIFIIYLNNKEKEKEKYTPPSLPICAFTPLIKSIFFNLGNYLCQKLIPATIDLSINPNSYWCKGEIDGHCSTPVYVSWDLNITSIELPAIVIQNFSDLSMDENGNILISVYIIPITMTASFNGNIDVGCQGCSVFNGNGQTNATMTLSLDVIIPSSMNGTSLDIDTSGISVNVNLQGFTVDIASFLESQGTLWGAIVGFGDEFISTFTSSITDTINSDISSDISSRLSSVIIGYINQFGVISIPTIIPQQCNIPYSPSYSTSFQNYPMFSGLDINNNIVPYSGGIAIDYTDGSILYADIDQCTDGTGVDSLQLNGGGSLVLCSISPSDINYQSYSESYGLGGTVLCSINSNNSIPCPSGLTCNTLGMSQWNNNIINGICVESPPIPIPYKSPIPTVCNVLMGTKNILISIIGYYLSLLGNISTNIPINTTQDDIDLNLNIDSINISVPTISDIIVVQGGDQLNISVILNNISIQLGISGTIQFNGTTIYDSNVSNSLTTTVNMVLNLQLNGTQGDFNSLNIDPNALILTVEYNTLDIGLNAFLTSYGINNWSTFVDIAIVEGALSFLIQNSPINQTIVNIILSNTSEFISSMPILNIPLLQLASTKSGSIMSTCTPTNFLSLINNDGNCVVYDQSSKSYGVADLSSSTTEQPCSQFPYTINPMGNYFELGASTDTPVNSCITFTADGNDQLIYNMGVTPCQTGVNTPVYLYSGTDNQGGTTVYHQDLIPQKIGFNEYNAYDMIVTQNGNIGALAIDNIPQYGGGPPPTPQQPVTPWYVSLT